MQLYGAKCHQLVWGSLGNRNLVRQTEKLKQLMIMIFNPKVLAPYDCKR